MKKFLLLCLLAACSPKPEQKKLHVVDRIITKIDSACGPMINYKNDSSLYLYKGLAAKDAKKFDRVQAIVEQTLNLVSKDQGDSNLPKQYSLHNYSYKTPYAEIE